MCGEEVSSRFHDFFMSYETEFQCLNHSKCCDRSSFPEVKHRKCCIKNIQFWITHSYDLLQDHIYATTFKYPQISVLSNKWLELMNWWPKIIIGKCLEGLDHSPTSNWLEYQISLLLLSFSPQLSYLFMLWNSKLSAKSVFILEIDWHFIISFNNNSLFAANQCLIIKSVSVSLCIYTHIHVGSIWLIRGFNIFFK